MTGWKSIFALGPFPKYINELNADESEELLAKFKQTILDNHDLTVRFKWRNENDIGKSSSCKTNATVLMLRSNLGQQKVSQSCR